MTKAKSPINWNDILALTNNKPALAKKLILLFSAELPVLRAAINAAFQQRDFELLKKEFEIGIEMTQTQKVMRRVLDGIYSEQMKRMYEDIHTK